jgi:hypothetical protein
VPSLLPFFRFHILSLTRKNTNSGCPITSTAWYSWNTASATATQPPTTCDSITERLRPILVDWCMYFDLKYAFFIHNSHDFILRKSQARWKNMTPLLPRRVSYNEVESSHRRCTWAVAEEGYQMGRRNSSEGGWGPRIGKGKSAIMLHFYTWYVWPTVRIKELFWRE